MGQSTNGILFYGYCWDDEVPDPADYDPDYDDEGEPRDEGDPGDRGFIADLDDWADATLRAQGHRNPLDDCPAGDYHAFRAANGSAIDAYYELKQQLKDAQSVDWGTHCSDSAPMPYLFIKGTEATAYRCTPKPITTLAVGDDWKQQLDDFLGANGIDAPEGENQPGWWLASYWG